MNNMLWIELGAIGVLVVALFHRRLIGLGVLWYCRRYAVIDGENNWHMERVEFLPIRFRVWAIIEWMAELESADQIDACRNLIVWALRYLPERHASKVFKLCNADRRISSNFGWVALSIMEALSVKL